MHVLGRAVVIMGAVAWAAIATAQESPAAPAAPGTAEPTVEQLERQVRELAAQLRRVEAQLAELTARQAETAAKDEKDRLRKAAAAAAQAASAPAGPEAPQRFVSGTRMQPQLNPEISVVGSMYALAGDGEVTRASVGEWELDLQSYLDPYSRFHVVLGKPEDEGLEVEEGYVSWMHLPGHMTLTAGRKRQQFGTLNRWHPHALDQVGMPLVLQESFGPEGLKGTGLSAQWLLPPGWADANELTVEVTNGSNDVAFAGEDWRKPSFLAHLKSYWDLNPDSYLEIGITGLHGSADRNGNLDHDFAALNATYNWYPSGRSLHREVTVRGMLLFSRLDLSRTETLDAWGGYLYGQTRLSPRWTTGVRVDGVEDQRQAGHRVRGVSPYLTFTQSEFVRLRGQLDVRRDNRTGTDRRFVLQLTVAAGPHKHETY